MRPSEKRTKVAVLRSVIGLSAKEFAVMIGKSIHTIKSLESGRLRLSEDLASRISAATSVSMAWLLVDEKKGPPVDRLGDVITPRRFEAYAARLAAGGRTIDKLKNFPEVLSNGLFVILTRAEKLPAFELAAFRVAKLLSKLEQDLLPPEERMFGDLSKFYDVSKNPPKKSAGSSESSKKPR